MNPPVLEPNFKRNGFSDLHGNGRLKVRRFDGHGMDSPWAFYVRWFRIEPNETIELPLNLDSLDSSDSYLMPEDVERLKIVMWWPEENLSGGADIFMSLYEVAECSGGNDAHHDWSFDTKKKISLIEGVGDKCWKLRISSGNIPFGSWETGWTRTVYFAYYWEDTDRDDWDGPPEGIF